MPECYIMHLPAEQILNWMKSHLDAYLATAKVILEQEILVPWLEWLWFWEVYSIQ